MYQKSKPKRKLLWLLLLLLSLLLVAAGGFLHPLSILLAFTVSWALAVLLRNLCLESISCINPKAFNALGYASELVLLFLGILFYVGV